ncbi:zinc-dependent metalloprotease [Tamlana sp. I1]|uniref:zinc-dependent metalloprotease n=1 Tax=Tamlana sp. I1 TaxID=2762061 RepID=UPI00188DFEE6|nr:T9SS type A sorting domain-containing protein [Tamlana sp. I1]
MKKLYFILFVLFVSQNLIFSQVENDLLPFDAETYTKRDNWHIAIFPIDFADIPPVYRAKFPDKSRWSDIIFTEDISTWFHDMSYGTTTITGDVFDYTTSSDVFFDTSNNSVMQFQDVLDNLSFTAPSSFDINDYDYLVFLFCHDAVVQQSITTNKTFEINGTSYTQSVVTVSYRNGVFQRNPSQFAETDQLTEANSYLIPLGKDMIEEGDANFAMKEFESVLLHELGHSMGLDHHANSSTNGDKPAHETPEVPNNSNLLNQEYGNKYALMGKREYGLGMNGAMRDVCGLIDAQTIYSKNWWGKTTVTVHPVSSATGKRFIEVLLPDERDFLGFKNHGYELELRTNDAYNSMFSNPELSNNIEGFFVHKVMGTENLLLDMSPSANIDYFGDYFADLRDVVLKPGMMYENDDVKFDNVVDNTDGTWSVDIEIKASLIVTPAPTFSSATRLSNGNIKIDWVNNCSDCSASEVFTITYRKVGDPSWNYISDADLNSGTYTNTSLSGNTDDYEFRGSISGSATHYDSLYSNTVSTSSLGVDEHSKDAPKIHPNPTSSKINIELDAVTHVAVYNTVGEKVLEKSNTNTIDVQNLKSGIYFLKISSQGKSYYKKFIKK